MIHDNVVIKWLNKNLRKRKICDSQSTACRVETSCDDFLRINVLVCEFVIMTLYSTSSMYVRDVCMRVDEK